MNNIFQIRKVNKTLKINSDTFLGMGSEDIDIDIKEYYENNLKNKNINYNIILANDE
jgi:hypothetical protein